MHEFKTAKLMQRDGVTTNWQGGTGGGADETSLKQLYQLPKSAMRRIEKYMNMTQFMNH